jgi:dTDP-4-dehydrorhamnose reductase
MKVLITGGAGFLGSTLIRKTPDNVTIHATIHENRTVADKSNAQYHTLDIRNENQTHELINKIKPDVIIHTAAKGSPDFCEKNPNDAWNINVHGTQHILKAAHAINAKVFAMSSNQVFDGVHGPFNENSETRPLNVYGKTKKQNEDDMLEYAEATIVRPITMYGWSNPQGQQNMAQFVIKKLTNKESIKVTNDMFNNYLYVGQMANAIWEMILQKYDHKIINIAGDERVSLSDFALKVASIFDLDSKLIEPVPKNYFKDESPRPMDTSYDISAFKTIYKTPALSLERGLLKMKLSKKLVTWKNI